MRILTLSLLAVVLIATIGLGWMFDNIYSQYSQQSNRQSSEQHKDAISVLEQLGSNLAQSLDGLDNRQLIVNKWRETDLYQLSIIPMKSLPLPGKLYNEVRLGQPLTLETDDSIAIHFYLPSSDELLVLSAPPISVNKPDGLINFLLTSLFYLSMLLLIFLWLYPLARRLLALRQVAKSFGEGKLEQRVNVGTISYIRDLELEFNHMAQRIEDLVNDVKLLSSAVSHDLRTPLARIRFGIDTLQEEEDPVQRRRYEQRISDNVNEMVDLVETLLNYARLDQAMLEINKTKVNLSSIVTSCIENKLVDNIEISFPQHLSEIRVFADPSYLMILVSNLIQNATQYCQKKVEIELFETQDSVTLSISDDGPGIAPEQREKIIKPFIRGDDRSNGKEQKIKGYGMGLAIVKRILEWHQGELHIGNATNLSGAKISIKLPKKN